MSFELQGISKRFGSLRANSGVSLVGQPGRIHAIIGENGAGKSTAMKILYGMIRPDEGKIVVDGREWGVTGKPWRSPRDAIANGIGMVHQHFMLAETETALENAVLARGASRASARAWDAFRPLDLAGARRRLQKLSEQYGLHMDWDRRVADLPVGIQQRLEILKLLDQDARLLILDEPTAVLIPREAQDLFTQLRALAAEGRAIFIITHKLKEVMALAHEVTVFRAGQVVLRETVSATSAEQLADAMVGRKVKLASPALTEEPRAARSAVRGEPKDELPLRLRIENLRAPGLRDISFEVQSGEILGIAGIEGNGQSELLRLLVDPSHAPVGAGSIRLLGKQVNGWPGRRLRQLRLGVIPEDRHRDAVLLEEDLRHNYLLGLHRGPAFAQRGWINWRRVDAALAQGMEEYDVRPRDPSTLAGALSGGNQQKLVIAREFRHAPELLIAAQPTRGVDVGAIEMIHARIMRARTEGAGVLLVSSELDEILALSDRIFVMNEGRFVAQFNRGQVTERELGLAMGGARS